MLVNIQLRLKQLNTPNKCQGEPCWYCVCVACMCRLAANRGSLNNTNILLFKILSAGLTPPFYERGLISLCVRYSLFLQKALLLLPVRLYGVLREILHKFQRLFDFHQNLIDFTAFNLLDRDRETRLVSMLSFTFHLF